MDPLDLRQLPEQALLLLDTAAIVYLVEAHPQLAARFMPILDLHAKGDCRFAVTTITVAEVLAGPLQSGDEALARRYRAVLESWQCIELNVDIAESAARLRASAALVTHDRDLSRVKSLRVLC